MKKTTIWRWSIYALGVVILAMGAILGTKTGMGISPINAIPFALNNAFGVPFSMAVFGFYMVLIAVEFLLRGKHRRWQDLFQLPFSVVFSSLLGLFENVMEVPESIVMRFIVLAASILLLGLGVALMVNMRIAPNPADGLADTIGWKLKRDMGLGKNILDACVVTIAFFIDLIFGTLWTSIGIATVLSSIFIGRAVYLFNRLLQRKILALAGLERTI